MRIGAHSMDDEDVLLSVIDLAMPWQVVLSDVEVKPFSVREMDVRTTAGSAKIVWTATRKSDPSKWRQEEVSLSKEGELFYPKAVP